MAGWWRADRRGKAWAMGAPRVEPGMKEWAMLMAMESTLAKEKRDCWEWGCHMGGAATGRGLSGWGAWGITGGGDRGPLASGLGVSEVGGMGELAAGG